MISAYAIMAISGVLGFFIIKIFTRLEKQANSQKLAWQEVEAQLKRRHSLIPQLVEVVKSHHQSENQVFISIHEHSVKSRSMKDKAAKMNAERCLNDDLDRIMTLANSDDEINDNPSFAHISRILDDISVQLNTAATKYNLAVHHYNEEIEKTPNNLVAQIIGHKSLNPFTIESRSLEQGGNCRPVIY